MNYVSRVAPGHPVRLRKEDIKNTKKVLILEQNIEERTIYGGWGNSNQIYYSGLCNVVKYTSGISVGEAIFPNTPDGNKMLTKFLKLLER